MIFLVTTLLAAVILVALVVVGGFVAIYKKWDDWSASILMEGLAKKVPQTLKNAKIAPTY